MPITLDGTLGITTPSYGGADAAEYLVPVTAFKNRIINGAMVIDQRNAGASVSAGDGTFGVDRFRSIASAGSKGNIQQNQGSVTPPAGFVNYFGFTTTSAYSVGAGDVYTLRHQVEGFNMADFNWGSANAKTVTLSFWVRSSLTGTFAGGLWNSAQDRSFPFSYTISAANTWEYETITITGDTTGTWLTTNGTGVGIDFSLGAGSNYNGTANTWQSGYRTFVSGATSVVGTNGATFYITGVQLEVGSTATSFDYRPYGTELQLCQRYFYRLNRTTGGDNTVATGTNSPAHNIFVFKMPTELRTKPTITKTGTGLTVYSAGSNTPNPTLNSTTPGTQQSRIIFNLTGSSGNSCWIDLDNDNTYFDFSSEL